MTTPATPEKSPRRIASVSTFVWATLSRVSRMPSYEPMKKVRLRRIGPPITPPNWWRSSCGLGLGAGAKKLRASIASLRM